MKNITIIIYFYYNISILYPDFFRQNGTSAAG